MLLRSRTVVNRITYNFQKTNSLNRFRLNWKNCKFFNSLGLGLNNYIKKEYFLIGIYSIMFRALKRLMLRKR